MRNGRATLITATLCLLCGAAAAFGQSSAPDDAQPAQSLAGAVVDPTAPLKSLTLQDKIVPSHWGMDEDANEVDLQLGIPHSAFGKPNILRITIPYLTSTPTGERGLTDAAVFDIVLLPQTWGTLAVGGVASFGTNKGPDADTFSLGPAIGAVFKKPKWTYGVFSQNLFSFGDIATTQLQPILAYTVSDTVSVSLGDAQYTIDWKKGRFVNVPIGFQANYIGHLGAQPVRLFINPLYNVKNEFGARRLSITLGLGLIVK